jgi:hypothetical protein
MGNRHFYKIECRHTLGTAESERLKVTALNLFHPTASPSLPKSGFFHIATQSLKGEEIFLENWMPRSSAAGYFT